MAYRHIQLPLEWHDEPETERSRRLCKLDALDDFLLIVEEVNLLGGSAAPLHPWLRQRLNELGGRFGQPIRNGADLVEAIFTLQESLMREPVARGRPQLEECSTDLVAALTG